MIIRSVLLFIAFVQVIKCARILGVFPAASISHQVVYQPIWKELSLRGHDVTVITPNPLKDPTLTNLTEIDVSVLYERISSIAATFKSEVTPWNMLNIALEFMLVAWEHIMNTKEVVELLEDSTKEFDVVIAEYIMPLVATFAYKYKCPLIGIISANALTTTHEAVGNPTHPLLYPSIMASHSKQMTFVEKINTIAFGIYERYQHHYNYLPRFDKYAKKYFGEDIPYLGDLERNMSLLIVNTNPIFQVARPYVPGVVEMEMMHIKPKKPLPEDLQDYLDASKEGAIYFSLGSNVKSAHIDANKRKIIMEAFSELPYKVLWKFENDTLENKPANVKIGKWLPQQDILGHPNIKLFITQAGLQSTEEAIYNQVPLLALPFKGDQPYNAKKITELGIGLNLDFGTLEKDAFKSAILDVIQNRKYKEKIKEISELIRDRPMNALDRVVWWTEYVIRHKGTPYFRSAVVDMPWYEYFLLDLIAFLLAVCTTAAFLMYAIAKYILKRIKFAAASKKQKTN